MYPQIKVREQDDLIVKPEVTSSVVRVVESISIGINSSYRAPEAKSGREGKTDPPSPHAKISASSPKKLTSSSFSTCKGKNTRSFDEDNTKFETDAPHAKISTSSKKLTASFSACKGKNTRNFNDENIIKARANLVARPRAVLSSPENDDLIGNQNQSPCERRTFPTNQSSGRNAQTIGELCHKNSRPGTPPSKKLSKESNVHCRRKERKHASGAVAGKSLWARKV